MLNKIINLAMNAQHLRMYKQHLGKNTVKVLYELSCVAIEETMDSTDSGPAKWSYGEWRVTVYDVLFGELRFLDSYTT